MRNDQEAYFAMYLKVKNFYTKNAASMTAVPAVVPFFNQLNTQIAQLITADTGSLADITGYAIAKSFKRTTLETLCLKVSNAVTSYAVVNNDFVLQKRADFPTSNWYKYTEDELISQATIVKNLATPLAASLTPFGATAAEVTQLGTATTAFVDVVSDPTLAIDVRKDDNSKVVDLIEQIRNLLNDKLDVLMRSFEVNNPSLFNLYKSARAIDSNGTMVSPTTIFDIPANTTTSIHTALNYDSSTLYTVQNMGNASVNFSLSTIKDTEGPNPVDLSPGNPRSRQADNLAPDGTFFTIKNENATIIKVRLWVE